MILTIHVLQLLANYDLGSGDSRTSDGVVGGQCALLPLVGLLLALPQGALVGVEMGLLLGEARRLLEV